MCLLGPGQWRVGRGTEVAIPGERDEAMLGVADAARPPPPPAGADPAALDRGGGPGDVRCTLTQAQLPRHSRRRSVTSLRSASATQATSSR